MTGHASELETGYYAYILLSDLVPYGGAAESRDIERLLSVCSLPVKSQPIPGLIKWKRFRIYVKWLFSNIKI